MKKIIIVALILMGATYAKAQQKLVSAADSVSYAAGWSQAANGLIPFLKQQYSVDEKELSDFVRGLEEASKKKDDKKFNAYRAGMLIAEMIDNRMLPAIGQDFEGTSAINREVFYRAFIDYVLKKKGLMSDSLANAYFKEQAEAAHKAKTVALREPGEKFLAENKQKEGVQTTESGLQYRVITEGTGEKPTAADRVKVKYSGKLIDGTVFDASDKHTPDGVTFGVSDVIRGWTEGLQLMSVGSKYQLFIPYNLAYGERGMGDIPAYATLIFDVELVEIVK